MGEILSFQRHEWIFWRPDKPYFMSARNGLSNHSGAQILENTLSTDYLSEIRFDAKVGSQLFESEAEPATKKARKSDERTAENRLKTRFLVFRSGLKGYCYTRFE